MKLPPSKPSAGLLFVQGIPGQACCCFHKAGGVKFLTSTRAPHPAQDRGP